MRPISLPQHTCGESLRLLVNTQLPFDRLLVRGSLLITESPGNLTPALRAAIASGHAARELERIDSEVDLPLDADIPLIALVLAGGIVHVVVADLRNKVDARGKGDDRRNINDPGIIFLGVN